MSITYDTSIEKISEILTENMQDRIADGIRYRMMQDLEVEITKIARSMAKSLSGRVQAYHSFSDGKVNMTVIIDGVKAIVEEEVKRINPEDV